MFDYVEYDDGDIYDNVDDRVEYHDERSAVEALLEELFDSAFAIQKEKIVAAMRYLCERFKVDDAACLLDSDQLMIVHKVDEEEKLEKQQLFYRALIKRNVNVLREQLFENVPFEPELVKRAMSILCWETDAPLGEHRELRIQRTGSYEPKQPPHFVWADGRIQISPQYQS